MSNAPIPRSVTLSEQVIKDQAATAASGELSTLLNRLSLAGRMIAREIMRAGFVGKLGVTGDTNVQGEEVRALDVIANDTFTQVFQNIPVVSGLASEEMDDIHVYHEDAGGKYVVIHDPLDGSGNVDINGSMGTIFSIHRRRTAKGKPVLEDFLQQGSEQVAAGYILYGPSTMFVYTTGGPVNGFTLDRTIGTFFLTHPDMRIPEGSGSYAVNEANQEKWDDKTQKMVEAFRTGGTHCGKRAARYIGALVADFHRVLLKGGIYMYPGEAKKPQGKLRLLYENAPLAFIAKNAGGAATDGNQDILTIQPTELHQRTPLMIGSKGDVAEATAMLKEAE